MCVEVDYSITCTLPFADYIPEGSVYTVVLARLVVLSVLLYMCNGMHAYYHLPYMGRCYPYMEGQSLCVCVCVCVCVCMEGRKFSHT